MQREDLADRLVEAFRAHPQLALEFYCMASEVVDDFEDYGPALQADSTGTYTDQTVIRRLQVARNELVRLLAARRNSGGV